MELPEDTRSMVESPGETRSMVEPLLETRSTVDWEHEDDRSIVPCSPVPEKAIDDDGERRSIFPVDKDEDETESTRGGDFVVGAPSGQGNVLSKIRRKRSSFNMSSFSEV